MSDSKVKVIMKSIQSDAKSNFNTLVPINTTKVINKIAFFILPILMDISSSLKKLYDDKIKMVLTAMRHPIGIAKTPSGETNSNDKQVEETPPRKVR